MIGNAHRGFGRGAGARAVIIIESLWLRNGDVVVKMSVSLVRLPWPVRRFVMITEEERFILRAVLHELDGKVGDDICRVASPLVLAVLIDEDWIMIKALAGQDVPIIEACEIA